MRKKPGPKPWTPSAKQIKLAELAAEKGHTYPAIASAMGVSEDTLADRRKVNKQLSEAIARGYAKAIRQVEDALFTNAITPEVNKLGDPINAGNVNAQRFWLQNRANWREKVDVASRNLNADVPPTEAELERLSDAELEKIARGKE